MLQIEELFSEQTTFPISLLITTTFIFEHNANYPLGHRWRPDHGQRILCPSGHWTLCRIRSKKSIKEAKSPMFDNIPADEIQLSKVVVLDNPKNEPLTVIFNYIDNGRKSPRPLRATEKVTEVFGIIPQGTIHFVVHRPGTPSHCNKTPQTQPLRDRAPVNVQ